MAIEVYDSLMKTNPDLMWDFYTRKPVPYDLRTVEKLYLPTVNTTRYGLNCLIFRGNLWWNKLPTSIKINQSLTHYSLVLLFYTPWKHQETFWFSGIFMGYRKATPDCNGLTDIKNNLRHFGKIHCTCVVCRCAFYSSYLKFH